MFSRDRFIVQNNDRTHRTENICKKIINDQERSKPVDYRESANFATLQFSSPIRRSSVSIAFCLLSIDYWVHGQLAVTKRRHERKERVARTRRFWRDRVRLRSDREFLISRRVCTQQTLKITNQYPVPRIIKAAFSRTLENDIPPVYCGAPLFSRSSSRANRKNCTRWKSRDTSQCYAGTSSSRHERFFWTNHQHVFRGYNIFAMYPKCNYYHHYFCYYARD